MLSTAKHWFRERFTVYVQAYSPSAEERTHKHGSEGLVHVLNCHGPPSTIVESLVPQFRDNCLRIDVTKQDGESRDSILTDLESFPGKPAIFRGLGLSWPLSSCSLSQLELTFGKCRMTAYDALKDEEKDESLESLLKLMEESKSNFWSTGLPYIFDNMQLMWGDERKGSKAEILDLYETPSIFRNRDLFEIGKCRDLPGTPDYRWVIIGGHGTGTSIHTDPCGTSAWNHLVVGKKLWIMVSPEASPEDVGADPRLSSLQWFTENYDRVSTQKKYTVVHALQHAGETIFVPSGWWHAVLNVGNTFAVTQNYASEVNLLAVWNQTRESHPTFSRLFLEELKTHRPDLAKRIMQYDQSKSGHS